MGLCGIGLSGVIGLSSLCSFTCRFTMTNLLERIRAEKTEQFVAFLDLLGFSEKVKANWDDAARTYAKIIGVAETVSDHYRELLGNDWTTSVQIVSDSIIITGGDLHWVAAMAQGIQTGAILTSGILLRGGIAFGPHSQVNDARNTYAVSSALASAVAAERLAHFPRIILDRATGVEGQGRDALRTGSPLFMPCNDGLWMVVPLYTFDSRPDEEIYREYIDLLEPLSSQYKDTVHSTKYDWMLDCVDTVRGHMESLREEGEERAAEAQREDGDS